jgi:acyl-CoA reductase-like NAD-dependent aldehyde dehydrogenase
MRCSPRHRRNLVGSGQLTESAAASQKAIEKITAAIADLHGNVSDFEPKARSSSLSNAQALLSLERADLATIQSKVAAQRNCALAAGNEVARQIRIVRDRLSLRRCENIEAWIRDEFVINRIPCPISVLVENHRSVIRVLEPSRKQRLLLDG